MRRFKYYCRYFSPKILSKQKLSKRKLVIYVRAVTGLSFNESRKLCKKALWIAPAAYFLCFDYLVNEDPFINTKASNLKLN